MQAPFSDQKKMRCGLSEILTAEALAFKRQTKHLIKKVSEKLPSPAPHH